MLRVLPTELGEELARLQLQVCWKRGGDDVHLLELDAGFSILVELVDDVAEALEVRIDGGVERELAVRNREAANLGIVVTLHERVHIGRAGPTRIGEPVEPDVHVGAGSTRRSRRGSRRN